ncbi:MAG: Veg family protein [Clostridia bacterium]
MIHKDSLLQFKEYFDKNLGQEVSIKKDDGRNRILEAKGTIVAANDNHFSFVDSRINCRTTFNYQDLPTNKLQVTFEQDGRILGNVFEKNKTNL